MGQYPFVVVRNAPACYTKAILEHLTGKSTRRAVIREALRIAQRWNLETCAVFGPSDCSYCGPDGRISASTAVPAFEESEFRTLWPPQPSERPALEKPAPNDVCRQCGSHKKPARPGEASRNLGVAKRAGGIVCVACGAVLVLRPALPANRRLP